MTNPPHIDATPAEFISNDGVAYAMIGTVLDRSKVASDAPIHVLIGDDDVREYKSEYFPMFEFFHTPRTEQQVRDWMIWAGGGSEILRTLLKTQVIVRIDTRNPISAAKSLKGIRLITQCLPDGTGTPEYGLVRARTNLESSSSLSISVELAEAMWGSERPSDIPSEIKRTASALGLPRKVAAKRVLADIPMLLWHDYARLGLANA